MYILEDRSYYIRQSLADNLLKRKNKKILQNGLIPIYIDENFDILHFIKNTSSLKVFQIHDVFQIHRDKKLEEYKSNLRKHYSYEILSNKGDFKILSGYSIENDYFTKYQECLNIHTKYLALLNIINGTK